MSRIKKLSVHEAQKIAAGQVVERPANVVKELLENALDAQATVVTVYIEKAGKQLIRVVDNGCGMDEQDAIFCFGHHTTSKISTVDDLATVQTFGFRGEALSSISGVSGVRLVTKDGSSNFATLVELEGGTLVKKEPAAATVGTDIAVKNLFYNVPARKKFLRSDDTEWRQINLLFQAFCFDYPQIHFKLVHDDLVVHNCPPVSLPLERVAQLWGVATASNMVALVPQQKNDFFLSGFISHYQYARYDRSQIFIFVNRRWVRNAALLKALIKGYLNVLPADRYPVAALFIEIEPAAVDINIHPRKEEVLFAHPRRIEVAIQELVKKTLEHSVTVGLQNQEQRHNDYALLYQQKPSIASHARFDFDIPVFAPAGPQELLKNRTEETIQFSASFVPGAVQKRSHEQEKPLPVLTEQSGAQAAVVDLLESYTILGQYNKTYILLEQTDGLFLIDQHAAHERILYEQFLQRFKPVESITLLFPEIIELTCDAIVTLEPYLPLLQECGIGIELFGDQKLIVQSAPIVAKNSSFSDLVHTVIGWINEYADLDHELLRKTMHEKIHAQMACKAAVKAGDILSYAQMVSLLQELQKTTNRFSCPHGRPTGWLLSLYEIEKKFKRKV